MTPSLVKDTLREIRKTFSRFFSIFAILAVGVGFFAGVRATGVDMRLSADSYYRQTRLADLRILSTLGFSHRDVEAVGEVEGVLGVMPARFVDVITLSQENLVTRVQSLPRGEEGDPGHLNRLNIVEGRLPQSPDECVIDEKMGREGRFALGDTITFAPGKPDDDLEELLARQSYRVVGVAQSPVHVDKTRRGNTNIGNGAIDAFVYVPGENLIADYYSELYISYAPALEEAAYTDGYDRAAEELAAAMEALEVTQAPRRLDEVQQEAWETIGDAQAELDDGVREMEEKLAEAAEKIVDAQQKLDDGEREYREGLEEFEEEIGKAQRELEDGKQELDDGWEQYREGNGALREGRAELAAGKAQLDAAQAAYAAQKPQVDGLVATLNMLPVPMPVTNPMAAALIDSLNAGLVDEDGNSLNFGFLLDDGGYITAGSVGATVAAIQGYQQAIEAQLANALAQYRDGAAAMAEGQKELNAARKELEKARTKYEEGLAEFEEEKAKAEAELEDARQKIADGRRELEDGRREYEEKKAEAEAEVADAQVKLDDARADLAKLEVPEWYIQDRGDYTTAYTNYGDESRRIDNIATIFPVFFLGVAALVCLTTMTRMVEEQRGQIGVARALGYGGGAIAAKYLFYVLTASLLGSLTGLAICFKLFPATIYDAYNILYSMPAGGVVNPFHWDVGIVSCLAAMACAGGVTLLAVYGELANMPAQTMRPKAPKAGKRVLLERLPFLWQRLSFTYKVTIRNLFRYKKRVFMTVVGIAGCTALTLTGFGLSNVIDDIVIKQYSEIVEYDIMVVLDADDADLDAGAVRAAVGGHPGVTAWMDHYAQSMTLSSTKAAKNLDAYISVMGEPALMPGFVTLRTRLGHDPVPFTDRGVVITEKISILLSLDIGDTFTIRDGDNREFSALVAGITENYASHFVYMTPEGYRQVFGQPPEYNAILANLADPGFENDVAEEALALDGVLAVSFNSTIKKEFSSISSNLAYVVTVLIVSAGILAFVVLYNLININITERIREIATLKVLGFYDSEVSAYVYRENIILTLIGNGLGLLLGVALLRFVIVSAEVDAIMFGRDIYPQSFFMAFGLTMVFALLVNLAMYFKLKNISMVESMKSVD